MLLCRLQVEQVNVMESAGGPFVLALRSLRFRFLSASQSDSLVFIESCSFVDNTNEEQDLSQDR